MFFFTAKLPVRRVLIGLCVIGAAAWGVWTLSQSRAADTGVFLQEARDEVMSLEAKGMKTQEDRLNYLENLGWQVDAATAVTKEVMIPKEFDENYGEYNVLQQKQGFDLTKYQGKKVELTTVTVTNHPKSAENVKANVLVYHNRIIGGDVCQETEDGFIEGLADSLN